MDGEVVLRLDRVTARYLADMLYDVGEHIAAGAPIAPMSTDESERLGAVLQELWPALDIPRPYSSNGQSPTNDGYLLIELGALLLTATATATGDDEYVRGERRTDSGPRPAPRTDSAGRSAQNL